MAVESLAARIAPLAPAAIAASTEPKAVETAEILAASCGLTAETDAAFDEHHRKAWPFETDPAAVTTRIARVLNEPAISVDGAETGVAAFARFAAGLAAHAARPLLVVTHGTVLSLYAARGAGVDPVALWRGLGFPEALLLDKAGRLIGRIS